VRALNSKARKTKYCVFTKDYSKQLWHGGWQALNKSMAALAANTYRQTDSGLFVHKTKTSWQYVVNALLFMGDNKAFVNKLKSDFMCNWECHNLGDVKEFLHMHILRKDGSIYLDQTLLSTLPKYKALLFDKC
jgi:hypothetical protein